MLCDQIYFFENNSRYTVDNGLEEGKSGYKKLDVIVQM